MSRTQYRHPTERGLEPLGSGVNARFGPIADVLLEVHELWPGLLGEQARKGRRLQDVVIDLLRELKATGYEVDEADEPPERKAG